MLECFIIVTIVDLCGAYMDDHSTSLFYLCLILIKK